MRARPHALSLVVTQFPLEKTIAFRFKKPFNTTLRKLSIYSRSGETPLKFKTPSSIWRSYDKLAISDEFAAVHNLFLVKKQNSEN